MRTPNRVNPNVEEHNLLKKFLTARRLRPLSEVDPGCLDPKKRTFPPRPTKYHVHGLETNKDGKPTRLYIYFNDGSLRRVEMLVGGQPIFRTRGKAAVKRQKRQRHNPHRYRSN